MLGLLDDGLDEFDDSDLAVLALRSLLQNRRQSREIALRDYSEQLDQDAFLNEYPQAAGLFDRVAAAEQQAFINTMRLQ